MDYATACTLGTTSVPEAGEAFYGLGRDAAYSAAARGEIPTLRIGRRLRVPVAQVLAQLSGQTLDGAQSVVPTSSPVHQSRRALDTETDSAAGVPHAGRGSNVLAQGARRAHSPTQPPG